MDKIILSFNPTGEITQYLLNEKNTHVILVCDTRDEQDAHKLAMYLIQ